MLYVSKQNKRVLLNKAILLHHHIEHINCGCGSKCCSPVTTVAVLSLILPLGQQAVQGCLLASHSCTAGS